VITLYFEKTRPLERVMNEAAGCAAPPSGEAAAGSWFAGNPRGLKKQIKDAAKLNAWLDDMPMTCSTIWCCSGCR